MKKTSKIQFARTKFTPNRTRTTTISIAFLLMASIALSILTIPNTNALAPAPGKMSIPTYSFINVSPNPIGVGQAATVNFFLNQAPPTALYYYGDRWHNMTVLVTKPDGTTQTMGPFSSDATGGTFTTYTPDKVGNYTFVLNFAGQLLTGENPSPIVGTVASETVGNYYMPSVSEKAALVVQETPIQYSPFTPLPTQYWTRPIFAMNTNWNTISGNWLGLGLGGGGFAVTGQYDANSNFNPYTSGPNGAHILWTAPYAPGGLIGGEFGNNQENSNFKSTSQYEPSWSPIVINGVLYYTQYTGAGSNPSGFVAVDLQTGKTLWTKNYNELLVFGQLLDYVTPNQYGATPYLWGEGFIGTGGTEGGPILNGTFSLFDATTGDWILNIVNGPSWGFGCVATEAKDGTIIAYYTNFTDFTINCWNSTKAIQQYSLTSGQNINMWLWRPAQGASIDWSLGLEWTAPIPMAINGVPIDNGLLMVSKVADGTVLLNTTPTYSTGTYSMWNMGFLYQAGIDANTGQLIWGPLNQTRTPWTRISGNLYDIGVAGNGIWVEYTSETASWDAYSLKTGHHVWGPVSGAHNAESYFNIHSDMAYGTMYSADYGGYVNAFNVTTGKLLWTWNTGSSGLDAPFGNWPVLHIDAIADGKLYVIGGHTYSPPLYHNAKLYCLNATTGSEIWSINCFTITNGPETAIADGILLEPNAYDNQIYAFGMGPTKLTVNAPAVGVTTATPITISGTISDISPGADQLAVAKNFPNGLPCVSDASQSQFMEAVYQQQQMPTNLTGVPVVLSVLDSNGNYRTIGTTTSDGSGTFAYTWTPDISGDFTVVATFAGSNSYYPSNAEAHFYASSPATTLAPTQIPIQSMADQYFLPSVAAIIVVIIIGFAVLALLVLRKKP